jgi:hypothetical protein
VLALDSSFAHSAGESFDDKTWMEWPVVIDGVHPSFVKLGADGQCGAVVVGSDRAL